MMTDIFCQSYLSISHLSLSSNDQRNTMMMKNMMRLMKRKKKQSQRGLQIFGSWCNGGPFEEKRFRGNSKFLATFKWFRSFCESKMLDNFSIFPFCVQRKNLSRSAAKKTWSANGTDGIPRVGCVKTKPSQGIRESKTSSKFLKSNSRIGRA